MTIISEKDKNQGEEFDRFWISEFNTHQYQFDRQDSDIAMLKTLTKAELQDHFEKLLFRPNRANRLDMHWNSQPHMTQAKADGQEESKADTDEAEEELIPDYSTEKRHLSVN